MLAHVIAGADLWRVDIESQRAPKEDIAESVETCPAETTFDEKRRAVLAVLGFDEDTPTVTGRPLHRPPFAPLFARLLELPDQIGSASCRERVCQFVLSPVVAVSSKKKKQ